MIKRLTECAVTLMTGERGARVLLPKWVKRVKAKGRTYYYFDTGQRVDGKKVYTRLPDLRDPKFGGSYAALLGHRNRAPANVLRVPKLIELYQKSDKYKQVSSGTKRVYDIYHDKLAQLLPIAPVAEITRMDMQHLFDGLGGTPAAANAFLAASRVLFAWALNRGYCTINPCLGIDKNTLGEHDAWPATLVEQGLVSDDPDIRRLTHMLYFTGQRINDVLSLTWNDIKGDHFLICQRKTGKELRIRIHRRLAAELASRPREAVLICVTPDGRPLRDQTARLKLQAFARDRGHEVVPHGLRKSAVIALLEAGCSIAETAAISGQTLRMVEHYAKQRNQAKLADAAVLRWEEIQS